MPETGWRIELFPDGRAVIVRMNGPEERTDHLCPECGFTAPGAQSLAVHRGKMHPRAKEAPHA